jgi:hypothetical protein
MHTATERSEYHPHAGHGYQEGYGWTHPDLDPTQRAQVLAGADSQKGISGEVPQAKTAPAGGEV